MERLWTCVVLTLPCALMLIVPPGCTSPRSFEALAVDAEAVPVPAGVMFVRQVQGINDGPGFTTTKSEQVTRQYRTTLPCQVLENSWVEALRAAGRRYRIAHYPRKFGAVGSLEIEINDRPEPLGITLGTDDGNCANPFVYSFNLPH